MTKPKPRSEHKVNSRTLTGPLELQNPRVRRNRAFRRALEIVKYKHLSEFQAIYRKELEKVGLA